MTPLLSTVILDPTTAMVGGGALALFSAKLIWARPELELKRTALLGAGWGLWFGITVGWMFFNYPDWMLTYLVDAKALSIPLAYVLFVTVLMLHGFVAALGVGALVMHKKLGAAIAVTLGLGAVNLLIMALQAHAYNHFGTYAEYWAGTARELVNEPRAQMGMTVAGIMAAPVAFLALGLRFFAGRKVAAASGTASPSTPAARAAA